MNLSDLQKFLSRAVCESGSASKIEAQLVSVNAPGVRIYRNSYLSTLDKQLRRRWYLFAKHCSDLSSHSADDFFRTFIEEHPPAHADLNRYGEGFAEFVGERGLSPHELDDLATILRCDVARFELLKQDEKPMFAVIDADAYKIHVRNHIVVRDVSGHVATLMAIDGAKELPTESSVSVAVWICDSNYQISLLTEDTDAMLKSMREARGSAEVLFSSTKEARSLTSVLEKLIKMGLVVVSN